MYEPYQQYYKHLQNTGKYRSLPEVSLPTFPNKETWLDFSTNDYLGFSHDPKLLQAAYEAGQDYGVGATGSRLLSGNTALHEAFEACIAKNKGSMAALIFNSGFQANVSVLSSLLDPGVLKNKPLVFFDKLNHSSLYQAVWLSGAELIRYNHNNMQQLSQKLDHFQHSSRPKFIVSETLFGMEGDVAPLEILVELAHKHCAFLYLDEAHATGILGTKGYGMSTLVNLNTIEHCVMGTFSKAIGCSGAYVACSLILKNYFLNKAPGFIYSTALSPLMVGAAYCAWKTIELQALQRKQLQDLGIYCRAQLHQRGFDTGNSTTPIIPIIIGQENRVMQLKMQLYQHSIKVSAIRPPTVPPGSARLRLSLTVHHTPAAIDRLVNTLEQLMHVSK